MGSGDKLAGFVKGVMMCIVSAILVGWLVFDFIPSSSAPDWAKALISITLLIGDVVVWVALFFRH